jgi:predicted RNase H-like nuclease
VARLVCIGLDLAWSARNPSGVATLEVEIRDPAIQNLTGYLLDSRLLGTNEEIVDYIQAQARGDPCLVAVDAPLRVPNLRGQRQAEAELNRVFRPYAAGAHPANRRLLERNGQVRGEALVQALARYGFQEQASIEQGRLARQVTEVFPHSAIVSLFGLSRSLPYKARPRRSWQDREQAWRLYQQHLRALASTDPSLQGHEPLLQVEVGSLRGRQLKSYEDQVDALMCAYIALYGFRWGSQRCHSFGSLQEGHIFTPLPKKPVDSKTFSGFRDLLGGMIN